LQQFVDHLERRLDVFEGLGVEEYLDFHCCSNESERVGLLSELRQIGKYNKSPPKYYRQIKVL
jgi:hypothetical protein